MSGLSLDKLLEKVSSELGDSLVFAGILDNNAKLLSFRRGGSNFSLPVERHDTLDVQVSLMFSLIRQLEDIAGAHRFTMTRFARYDIFLLGTSDIHIFIVTAPGSGESIAGIMGDLVDEVSGRPTAAAASHASSPVPSAPVMTPPATAAAPSAASASATARGKDLAPIEMRTPATGAIRSPSSGSSEVAHKADAKSHFAPSSHSPQAAAARRPRPESIVMLQGYLLGVQAGLVIEEDSDVGGYKIKTGDNAGGRVPWPVLENINTIFGDRIDVHYIDRDRDGNIAIRVSAKDQ